MKFRFNRLAQQISNRDAFNIFGQQLIGLVSIQNRSMFPGVIATALNRCHATTDQANGELIFVSLDHDVFRLDCLAKYVTAFSEKSLPLPGGRFLV
ncbi:hypothetical protein [Methylobacter sp.]|uniref:hypothetical protein n=1 Tax=Methylobacter sp. TaxID=2051955 RepID=UPI003DA42F24